MSRCGYMLVAPLLGLVSGCTRHANVVLHQSFAPPAQQNLKLTSDRAYFSLTAEHDACLLAFALPGSRSGPRAFVVYLRAPRLHGEMTVDPSQRAAVRGFLVQEVGALAGRSNWIGGTVRFRPVPLAPEWRLVDLDVRCEDGTLIRGRARAESVPHEIRSFERQYAADMALLVPDAENVDGQTTGTRRTAAP